jgi:hypothetical protein
VRRAAELAEIQRRSYAEASPAMRATWPERQAPDETGLEKLLGRRRYAVLATARPDGRPHAAPVAFTVQDGAWVGTVEGLRLRNLRATPWASLVVMEGERDEDEAGDEPLHQALTAEGPVVLHEGTRSHRRSSRFGSGSPATASRPTGRRRSSRCVRRGCSHT